MAISLYFQALTPLCLYLLNLHIFKHLCAFIAKWTFYGNLQICAEAGFGRSIYGILQLLVPEKQSLTHQYVLHPLMLKIMNIYFYNGRLKCGANDILLESNKEFKSKLPFIIANVPSMEISHRRKGYITSAALSILLQQLSKGIFLFSCVIIVSFQILCVIFNIGKFLLSVGNL